MSHYNAEMDNIGAEKQKWIFETLQQPKITVFDIGGHVGESIEKYKSLFPDCRVYSFEPHPESFGEIFARYGSRNDIHCECLALGSRCGSATFHATRCSEVSSLLPPEDFLMQRSVKRKYDFSTLEVAIDTLDRVVDRCGVAKINILKIDVQGAEMEVLKGAVKLLRQGRIDLIYTEALFAETYTGQSDFNEIWTYLKSYNYFLWDLFPFLHTTMGRLWTANAIFLSAEMAARIDRHFPHGTPKPADQPDNAAENLSDYS